MFDEPQDVYTPELVLACLVPQGLKRNCYLDDEAVGSHHAFRLHHDVDTEVVVTAFGKKPILLNAQRIKEEFVGTSLVVEGVEYQSNYVVVKNVIALGDVRANLRHVVVGVEREI